MGVLYSPQACSSLQRRNPLLLLLCVCLPPWPLSPRLKLSPDMDTDMITMVLSMDTPTMAMDIPMLTTIMARGLLMLKPTMDTMDTPMPITAMDTPMPTIMARGPLMLSPDTDMPLDIITDMPTTDITDTPMLTTITRGPLMLSPDMAMPTDILMPMDMPTVDTTDIIINLLNIVKS